MVTTASRLVASLFLLTAAAWGVAALSFMPESPPSSPSRASRRILLKVCQSPACLDDGAASTLARLTALVPPGVSIAKGACVSFCGSGPIVEVCDDDDGVQNGAGSNAATLSSKRKKVKGDVLASLLDELTATTAPDPDPNGVVDPMSPFSPRNRGRLLDGYEAHLRANDAYESKDYNAAAELYEEAIQSGRKPALALEEARASVIAGKSAGDGNGDGDGWGYPAGLEWLVTSFRNSCRSRLALSDVDGARRDAFAATVFSKNFDAGSHECLAEVCKASGDAVGERQAVKAAMVQYELAEERFSKPMPGIEAPARAAAARGKTEAVAQRRELGFRLARLERELAH